MADIEFNLTGNAEEVAKQINEYLESIVEDTEDILQRTKNGLIDTTQAQKELDELLKKYRQLKNEASKEGYGEIFTSFEKNVIKGFIEARKQAKGWGDYFKQYSSKVISIVTSSLKKGFQTAFSAAKVITRTVFNGMIASFKGLGSLLKNSLSKVFSFGNGNGLFGNLTKLITLLGGLTVGKKLVDLSSEMYEFGRIADNVFGENAKEVEDWAKTVGSAYVDSTNAAQKYLGTIGTMFSNKGIDGDNLKEMSENVVKLTGDFANFYNLSKDDAFNKIQKALEGSAKALKDYGINVSDANVNAYLLAQGYKVQLSSLSEAEQQMVRYNYLLSENASIMGASANTATTWANQVDSLKGKLTEIGALLGNLLVKVLYPIIVALNTAADVALKFLSALAPIFNFDSESMKGILGGGGSTAVDNLEDEADAIDDVAKSAKKANAQLQGFDKLNNMTTSGDSSSKKGTGIGSIGMALSDWKGLDPADVKLPEWLQKLLNVLKAKDWKGLGKLFAEGINYISTALRSKLTDPSTYENISKLNTALIDLLKGMLSADFTNAGRMVGDFVNLLTFTIKDFFVKGIEEGVFSDAGKDLSDAIAGMVDEVDWTQAGESLTVGLRALLEGISSFLTTAKDNELGKKAGEAFREFIGGALEMLLGNGGDEKAGKAIADFINEALDFVVTLLTTENEEGKNLTEEITDHLSTIIATGIQNIDDDKLKKAASTLGSTLAKIMKFIATTLTENSEDISDGVAGAINGMVDDGTLSELAEGFSGLMFSIAGVLGKTAKKVDWGGVATSILIGIGDAMSTDEEGAATLGKALGTVFKLTAFGTAFSGALSIGGKVITDVLAKKVAGGGAAAAGAGEAATGAAGATSAVSGLTEVFELLSGAVLGAATAYRDFNNTAASTRYIIDTVKLSTLEFKKVTENTKFTKLFDTGDLDEYYIYLKGMNAEMALTMQKIDDISDSDWNKDSVQEATEEMLRLAEQTGYTSETFSKLKTYLENDVMGNWDPSAAAKWLSLLNDVQVELNEGIHTYEGIFWDLSDTCEEAVDTMVDNFDKIPAGAELSVKTANEKIAEFEKEREQQARNQNLVNSILNQDISAETESKLTENGERAGNSLSGGVSNSLDTNLPSTYRQSLVEEPLLLEGDVAETGRTLGDSINTGITEGLDSEALSDGLTTTIIDGVEVSKETYIEQGKTLGEYITDGIVEGLNGEQGILKITSAIKALCDEMEKSFRDNLEIHSPSRLFTRLTEYVPEGAAKGIENKLPLIEDSMAKVRSSMVEGFNSDLLTKIRNSFSDLTFEANLEASKVATQSNSRLEEGLASLIRGTGNTNGNQNIVVQLVLDGNVMQKFVLDTVNGNAVQNGGF